MFFDNHLAINLHGNPAYAREILLRPGKFREKGKLVNAIANDKTGKYLGALRSIDGGNIYKSATTMIRNRSVFRSPL